MGEAMTPAKTACFHERADEMDDGMFVCRTCPAKWPTRMKWGTAFLGGIKGAEPAVAKDYTIQGIEGVVGAVKGWHIRRSQS